jgi:hypothetical protein
MSGLVGAVLGGERGAGEGYPGLKSGARGCGHKVRRRGLGS